MSSIDSPRPRDVPGFSAAVAGGLTPRRPAAPPVPHGPTAHAALVRCGVVLAAAALLVVLVISAGPSDGGRASWADIAAMLAATAVGVGAMCWAIGRFRDALLAELAAGYVTTTFHQGMFWFVKGPGPKFGKDVTGWDWSGLWVLTKDGAVVSAPDLAADPPGFYPSPRPPGLELWTGSQWTGVRSNV